MIFPADWRGNIAVGPEKPMAAAMHKDEQDPSDMADLPAARPPHPFLLWLLRVEIQLDLAQAVHFVAELTVKFLIIRPDHNIGVGMHGKLLGKRRFLA